MSFSYNVLWFGSFPHALFFIILIFLHILDNLDKITGWLFYRMSYILSLLDVFSGRDSRNAYLEEMPQKLVFLSQYIIAGGPRLVCFHIGGNDNFDILVSEVSANFLHCVDTAFLLVLMYNPWSQDYVSIPFLINLSPTNFRIKWWFSNSPCLLY